MGNMWKVTASSDPELENFKIYDCEKGTEMIKIFIDEIIELVSRKKKLERTNDFKKYGLYPGQQICYGNVIPNMKSMTHCGIYLYDGIIIEAGSAPKDCIKDIGTFTTFFGLNSLKNFKKFAKNKRKSPVWKVITKKDSDIKEILKRLKRTKKIVGFRKFSIFLNCVQVTNYITFGEYRWTFPKNVSTEILSVK